MSFQQIHATLHDIVYCFELGVEYFQQHGGYRGGGYRGLPGIEVGTELREAERKEIVTISMLPLVSL